MISRILVSIPKWLFRFFFKKSDKKISWKYGGEKIYLQEAKVNYVKDGDTVEIWRDCEKKNIRLYGIDCPEGDQPWGNIAKAGLIKLIGGRNIFLEIHGVDGYGRTLATIYLKDDTNLINVNEKMVMKGHAWVMRRFYKKLTGERKTQLNRLEYWAKKNKAGLWREDNPTPPWQWRNGKDK